MSRRFKRRRDGIRLRLSSVEAGVLRDLPEQLRSVYGAEAGADPARDRLFPRAYLDPTEERAEQEWQELVYPELLRERLAALALVTGQLGDEGTAVEVQLTDEDAQVWLGVLNDLRLVLGTRLDVTDDPRELVSDLRPDDPRAGMWVTYSWLTEIQADLVAVLMR